MTHDARWWWTAILLMFLAGGCSRAIAPELGDGDLAGVGGNDGSGTAGVGGSHVGSAGSGTAGVGGSIVTAGAGAGAAGFAGGVVAGAAGGVAGSGFAGGGFAGGAGVAGAAGSGVAGGFAGVGGSAGAIGGSPAVAGAGGFGGGAGSSVMCDSSGTCYYSDGSVCYSDGTCCYPDGTCCNDRAGFCSGGMVPPPPIGGAPAPFPFPFPFPAGGPAPQPTPVPLSDEPWQAPIETGDDGWQDSTDPLCTEEQGYLYSNSVWSDSRGVFVLVGGESGQFYSFGPQPFPGYPFLSCADGYCSFERIYFNDGTGWDVYYELQPPSDGRYYYVGEKQLTGFEGGKLVLYGYEEGQELCGLSMVDSVSRECEPVWEVRHVFVVNDTLAYGILDGNVIVYDGDRWGPLPTVVSTNQDLSAIWANESDVFAVGWGAGRIYHLTEMGWSLENTRTLEQFNTIWGFASDDLWAGTEQGGLYHFDGTTWDEISWENPSDCQNFYPAGISGMWGSEGVLYFHTANVIGRVVDGAVEVLADWECPDYQSTPRITSLWGNGPDDVFVALQDDSFPRQECGTTFLLHYDGSEFHRF